MVRSHSRLPIHRPGYRTHPTARIPRNTHAQDRSSGGLMLKFLGSTVGIIFLIGLVVVILLLKFIF